MSSQADLLGAAVKAVADLPSVKGALGVVVDICTKIKTDAEMLRALKACATKQPFWPDVVPLFKPPALTIPSQPEFSAEKFAARGFWTSDNAKLALGIGQKKIWSPTEQAVVRLQELDRQAIDQEVWDSTGGVESLSYGPGQLYWLMQNLLAKDGCWYVAYVNGDDGNLWAVYFCWDAVGRVWYLDASRAPDANQWGQGDQFLVRDS